MKSPRPNQTFKGFAVRRGKIVRAKYRFEDVRKTGFVPNKWGNIWTKPSWTCDGGGGSGQYSYGTWEDHFKKLNAHGIYETRDQAREML